MQRVSFGDRPAGAIAIVALKKTAEMGKEQYPQAAKTIADNTYMDDIIDSVNDHQEAKTLMNNIESLIAKGGFQVKCWTTSSSPDRNKTTLLPVQKYAKQEKVLGVAWNPEIDCLYFKTKLNFSTKKKKIYTEPDLSLEDIPKNIPQHLTKRIILSQVNRIYDPLGLAGPITVRAKIMMRQLWLNDLRLDWDDPIPDNYQRDWIEFCKDLSEMESVVSERSIRPHEARGNPELVIFSDGSNNAYGACAYARWEMGNARKQV